MSNPKGKRKTISKKQLARMIREYCEQHPFTQGIEVKLATIPSLNPSESNVSVVVRVYKDKKKYSCNHDTVEHVL